MKVYRSTPTAEFRIVKPDSGVDVYEVWVTKPVCVGSISRFGNGNLTTDDKQRFRNIFLATQHILERAKEQDLAAGMRLQAASQPTNKVLSGWELLNGGKWEAFRKLRGLVAPADATAMAQTYSLNPHECNELGLANE